VGRTEVDAPLIGHANSREVGAGLGENVIRYTGIPVRAEPVT